MLKISLYHNYCLTLCKHIETPFYGNNQSYTIDRPATLAIRGWLSQWQKPCISYALPRNPAEITGFEIDRSRSTDRNDAHLRQFVGQALREEGVKGLETKPGRGRKPIMDCSDEESVRQAIEQDRQSVKKAKEAWQQASGKEASESTFRAFYPHWREI